MFWKCIIIQCVDASYITYYVLYIHTYTIYLYTAHCRWKELHSFISPVAPDGGVTVRVFTYYYIYIQDVSNSIARPPDNRRETIFFLNKFRKFHIDQITLIIGLIDLYMFIIACWYRIIVLRRRKNFIEFVFLYFNSWWDFRNTLYHLSYINVYAGDRRPTTYIFIIQIQKLLTRRRSRLWSAFLSTYHCTYIYITHVHNMLYYVLTPTNRFVWRPFYTLDFITYLHAPPTQNAGISGWKIGTLDIYHICI